jgi:uncharacterized membrane protein YfhO
MLTHRAIKECIRKGILKEYLLRKSSEVVNMLMAEYDYATDIEVQREEAAEEAREEVRAEAKKALNKNFIEMVENVAKNFQISIQEACEKSGRSYEEYLEIKNNL